MGITTRKSPPSWGLWGGLIETLKANLCFTPTMSKQCRCLVIPHSGLGIITLMLSGFTEEIYVLVCFS